MISTLCPRHLDSLELALTVRGFDVDRAPDGSTARPVKDAEQRLMTHATHFAGKAAIEMLHAKACPLCFVNQRLRSHLGYVVDDHGRPHIVRDCDGWVDNAADEIEHSDNQQPTVVIVS